ncbi:MAG TPA: MarR family transcriptional regulator [Jatrophihabitantaceae bacterium]
MTDRAPGDDVAGITAQWARERPELDVTPIEVFGRIAKLHRAQIEASEHAYRKLGISSGDFDVLATLRRAGRPYRLTPSELTSSMMISSGGVTQRVDRLERVGLVERRPHESDRRSTTVALTPGGRRLIDKAMPLHLDAERALLAGLSKADRTALAKLLKKALANSE